MGSKLADANRMRTPGLPPFPVLASHDFARVSIVPKKKSSGSLETPRRAGPALRVPSKALLDMSNRPDGSDIVKAVALLLGNACPTYKGLQALAGWRSSLLRS
jgi:hypothetical protein